MNAKQIKKEAREGFEKEFYLFDKAHGYEIEFKSGNFTGSSDAYSFGNKIKTFLDQLIDDTIKQTLEGVRLEEKTMPKWIKEEIADKFQATYPDTFGEYFAKGYNQAVAEQNKLAKEIKERR